MSPGKRSPLNILVVDDSAVVREVMTAVLAQEPGFSVTVAGDPFIAMGKMKQKRPDVIVLDLEMPRMDGLTFLRKIVREDFIPGGHLFGVDRTRHPYRSASARGGRRRRRHQTALRRP